MIYKIEITSYARKRIAALSSVDRARVIAAIRDLATNPRPHGSIKLTNRHEWRFSIQLMMNCL